MASFVGSTFARNPLRKVAEGMRAPLASLTCKVRVERFNKCNSLVSSTSHSAVTIAPNSGGAIMELELSGPIAVHASRRSMGLACLRLLNTHVALLISHADPEPLVVFLRAVVHHKRSARSARSARRKPFTSSSSHNADAAQLSQRSTSSKRPREELFALSQRAEKKSRRSEPSSSQPFAMATLDLTGLTSEQRKVLQVVQAGQSVFFTGSAGTGKSFLLKTIISALPPSCTFVTAATGIAACPLGGVTLHAFAGIGRATTVDRAVQIVSQRPDTMRRWLTARTLIIDEVSMIDGHLLDLVEGVARAVRRNTKPFGGLQLILTGDFYQLPPVTKMGQQHVFAFQSKAWQTTVRNVVELTQVFRQDDQDFVDALNEIRVGHCSSHTLDMLNDRVGAVMDVAPGIQPTRLMSLTADVARINNRELDELPGTAVQFVSKDVCGSGVSRSTINSMCRARRVLTLKVGAQVMLIRTIDAAKGLVNGAQGKVLRLSGQTKMPVVRFANGQEILIRRERWVIQRGGQVIACRSQLPLHLAWAISIHKSQGMSLDAVEMDLASVFEYGQAYVALSRARSLQGVRLVNRITKDCIRAHPVVSEFYLNANA